MITLQTLLLLLALHLPFPAGWADSVQVQFDVTQTAPGWLGYTNYADCCVTVIHLEPILSSLPPDVLRNVLAHEAYHAYFQRLHGTPTDPNDERGAYAFGCQAQYVYFCDGWLWRGY